MATTSRVTIAQIAKATGYCAQHVRNVMYDGGPGPSMVVGATHLFPERRAIAHVKRKSKRGPYQKGR